MSNAEESSINMAEVNSKKLEDIPEDLRQKAEKVKEEANDLFKSQTAFTIPPFISVSKLYFRAIAVTLPER